MRGVPGGNPHCFVPLPQTVRAQDSITVTKEFALPEALRAAYTSVRFAERNLRMKWLLTLFGLIVAGLVGLLPGARYEKIAIPPYPVHITADSTPPALR